MITDDAGEAWFNEDGMGRMAFDDYAGWVRGQPVDNTARGAITWHGDTLTDTVW